MTYSPQQTRKLFRRNEKYLPDVFGFALPKKFRVKNVSLWICFEDLGAYMTFYKFKL